MHTHQKTKANTSATSSCVATMLLIMMVCADVALEQNQGGEEQPGRSLFRAESEGDTSRTASGSLWAASVGTCATWQAVLPWLGHPLPYACESFHSPRYPSCLHLSLKEAGVLCARSKARVPALPRPPAFLSYMLPHPTFLPSVLSCAEWVCTMEVQAKSQKEAQVNWVPRCLQSMGFLTWMPWKGFTVLWICDCLCLGCSDRKTVQLWGSQ